MCHVSTHNYLNSILPLLNLTHISCDTLQKKVLYNQTRNNYLICLKANYEPMPSFPNRLITPNNHKFIILIIKCR